MASKYAEVFKRLEKLNPATMDGEKKAWADKVAEVKAAIVNEPYFDPRSASLASEYGELRRQADELEEQLKAINLRKDAIKELMDAQFEADGISSLTLASGDVIRMQPEPYAVVKDKEAFRLWCVENGLERSMTLPWQTTNAMTKERLLAGETPPPGVEAFINTKAVFTRNRAK